MIFALRSGSKVSGANEEGAGSHALLPVHAVTP